MSASTEHKPSRKGLRRREAILATAADLFAARGYGQTSMQDLADATGILKGSLYYYFASKEEVLFQVLLRNHTNLSDHVIDQVDYATLSGVEGVSLFIERHVDYVLRHAEISGLYTQEVGVVRAVEDWWSILGAARRRHEEFLIGLIVRGQDTGEATPDDPTLTARALLSMANAPARWLGPSTSHDREEIAAHHARLAVRAVRELPAR
jgi:AcrR family transcriptional regulator